MVAYPLIVLMLSGPELLGCDPGSVLGGPRLPTSKDITAHAAPAPRPPRQFQRSSVTSVLSFVCQELTAPYKLAPSPSYIFVDTTGHPPY